MVARVRAFAQIAAAQFQDRGIDPPPHHVQVLLARIAAPGDVRASFWSAPQEGDRRTVSGQVVLVTDELVHDIQYMDVATQWTSGSTGGLGTAKVRSIVRSSVDDARWTLALDRNPSWVDRGQIRISSSKHDWEVALPLVDLTSDAEGFYSTVLATFGLDRTGS